MVYELCLNNEEFSESRDGKCKGPVTDAVGCDDGGGGVVGRERGMEEVGRRWKSGGEGKGMEAVMMEVGEWWAGGRETCCVQGQEQCDQSGDREKECAKERGPGRRSEPSEQCEASFFPLKC